MFKVVLLVSVHFVSGFYHQAREINSRESYTKVRLVSGKDMTQGRLEVLVDGEWGTVCDDNFGVHNAQVVCRMLGIETQYPRVHTEAFFGEGLGNILLDDVKCIGIEFQILDCVHREIYDHDCGHGEDVGVDCSPGGHQLRRMAARSFVVSPCKQNDTKPRLLSTEPNDDTSMFIRAAEVSFLSPK